MHPNIKKIYLVVGAIFAFLWISRFIGLIKLGYVGFFLLTIFTVIYLLSLISRPNSKDLDFSPETGKQGP